MSPTSLVLGGGAPQYKREYKEPAYYSEFKKFNIDDVKLPDNLAEIGHFLLKQPNICSKKWIYEQYDSMVGTNNINTNAPSNAGIALIKGSKKGIAMTVDCNSRYVNADPEIGTTIAVSEAARNIVVSGGKPSAVTNCLNFGNPYHPESYWQFVGAIKGMSAACKKFSTPVTGGNVSFYNQSIVDGKEIPVFPTPTIGMIGLVDDVEKAMSMNFKNIGDTIYLLGHSKNDISSSEYLYNYHNIKASTAPYFNLDEEYDLHELVKRLITNSLVNAAHDCADGGLFVTLAEMGMTANLGFDVNSNSKFRKDAFLFGEVQGRVVVTVSDELITDFESFTKDFDVPFENIGNVVDSDFIIDSESFGNVVFCKDLYDNALASNF